MTLKSKKDKRLTPEEREELFSSHLKRKLKAIYMEKEMKRILKVDKNKLLEDAE